MAQGDDLFLKAQAHYDKKEYREALYFLKKVIAGHPDNAEALKMRGNCFLAVNQVDSAKVDYEKALKLAPDMAALYYNLSLVYREKKDNVSEEKFLRQFLKSRPEDTGALIRFGHLIVDEKPDSCLLLIEKAYSLDPHEIYTNDALAREYLFQRKYQEAYEFSKKARLNFPHHFELIESQAYSAFGLRKFSESFVLADTLNQMEPHISYRVLKAKSNILSKTKPENYTQEGDSFRFTKISNRITADLDQWATDSTHRYHYKTLLKRYHAKEILGLDEYFMLYYGFTTDARYSPYFWEKHSLNALMKDEKYQEVITEAGALLSKDEFDPRILEFMVYAQGETKHEDYDNTLCLYLGVIEGIIATGTGRSYETAWIVTAPSHEYDILGYYSLSSGMQSLQSSGGHSYDVLTTNPESDEKMDFYFNIDKPFGSLRQTMRKEEPEESKKQKKRKKKEKS